MIRIKHLLALALLMLMVACSSPDLAYYQGVPAGQVFQAAHADMLKIAKGDKLSVVVSSRDQQLAYIFNLQVVTQIDQSSNNLGYQRIARYQVDSNGDIDFPVLGTLHVEGLTREELASKVKGMLVSQELLKDAIVTVDILTHYYSVMGEVARPGRFQFDEDKVTVLEALSNAGDLTMYGQRNNLLVVRQDGDKYTTYRIDLTKADQIYSSPVFYLQKNDMVYVSPNKRRAHEASEMGTTLYNPSLWLSVASFLVTISVLIFK